MNKELELRACKVFVCPNLSLFDDICKKNNILDSITTSAKGILIEYLKKTYHSPRYSHVKFLFPAVLYIAYHRERDLLWKYKDSGQPITQNEISQIFGSCGLTMRKWIIEIIKELNIEICT